MLMDVNIFFKYSGAGNTFLLAKAKPSTEFSATQEFVKRICNPTEGFAADGVLFLEKKEDRIVWTFYNADGSSAEMCGNAARCAYAFSRDHFFGDAEENKPKIIYFQTLAGIIKAEKINDKICIEMPEVKNELGEIEFVKFQNQFMKYIKDHYPTEILEMQTIFDKSLVQESFLSLNTGVPHFLIQVKEYSEYLELRKFCSRVRSLPLFPRGTNVTLLKIQDIKSEAVAVTFERGVEDFTAACGTGAVAVGIFLEQKYHQKISTIKMPGGRLVVETNQATTKKPFLIGEAHFVGKIVL
jgi:diaminopimelate epimerase